MDRMLIEAADKGDAEKLHNLIRDNPLLLKAAALASGNTPLHIACTGGHLHFIKEVLNLVPEFAHELDQQGLSPLHIASACGDLDIVKELVKLGNHLCLIKGKEDRIPFHCSVVKGRIKVINELLSIWPDSIREVTARGETCYHLAVKNNQFEALKVLRDHAALFDKADILNIKDELGNTILHHASSRKQYEVVNLLLSDNFSYKYELEVNSLNKKGLTPLDILISEGGDSEIEEMLTLAGATRGADSLQNMVIATQYPSDDESAQEHRRDRPKSAFHLLMDYFKYDKINESPNKARNALLVTTVLIVTATYQAALNPPGGIWQEDFWPNSSSTNQPPHHTAGESIMATNNKVSYGLFLLFNSIGFFMSLHMMNFLTYGLPLQFELRIALIALTATYNTCMLAITPSGQLINVLFIGFIVLVPLLLPMVTKVVRDFKKRIWCSLNTRISG